MWLSSENTYNNVRFAIGALVLNRIISAIHSIRSVSKYNKNLEVETSWNINVNLKRECFSTNPSLELNFTKSF